MEEPLFNIVVDPAQRIMLLVHGMLPDKAHDIVYAGLHNSIPDSASWVSCITLLKIMCPDVVSHNTLECCG